LHNAKGLQDFDFSVQTQTSNLLFSLPLFNLLLWIYNVGPVIDLLSSTPSPTLRPHLCHSPLCLQEGMYFLTFQQSFQILYTI